jgi:hypothetical protein
MIEDVMTFLAAQIIMVPMALLVGRKANRWAANHSFWPDF